jgi:hypothetical protein
MLIEGPFFRRQTFLREKYDRCVVGKKGRNDKFKENFGNPYYEVFRCNICGENADFVVQLELVKERSNYNIVESVNQMPFYLCETHEYLYKKMQSNIELKNYFLETLRQNQ